MIYPKEHVYRKKLATNLELVEKGLSLIEEEYQLDNNIGTRGYVDILCRDRYGHIVVIEIKRSKSASRHALHELSKYIALVKFNSGLGSNEIRCILISTEWSELIVPFSEFCEETSYQVIGYKMFSDSNANDIYLEEVTLQKNKNKTYDFFRQHFMYLYTEGGKQKTGLINKLDEANIEGAIILDIYYEGEDKRVIYPFCHYLIITSLSNTSKEMWIDKNKEYYVENEEIEESILGDINYNANDILEIGYPEKLVNTLQNGWVIKNIYRYGTLTGTDKLIPDKKIVNDICGYSGEHSAVYISISNPKHKISWDRAKVSIQNSIIGNRVWEILVRNLLSLIESEYKDSDVSFYIYNPLNILYSISMAIDKNNVSTYPYLNIVVASNENNQVISLRSFLIASTQMGDDDVEKIIIDIYHDQFNYIMAIHNHNTWQHDDEIISKLGMKYFNVLHTITDSGTKTNSVDEALLISKTEYKSHMPVDAYVKENIQLRSNLFSFFHKIGIHNR